ncbi:hypothetical protein LUZ60_001609 [Juncus effusus]|nr:hypothetical protein LUZ60_001609 [Juncus effusus]
MTCQPGESSESEEELSDDKISNAVEINDWVNILDSFDKLNKQLEKAGRVYIKALALLEGSLARALGNKEAKEKMGKSNAQALDTMKRKLKKNNKIYEELIAKYRENQVEDEDQEAGKEESDDGESDIEGKVWGNLVAIVERLDSEFLKSLQGTDPHTKDYVERLRDEPLFMVVAQNVQEYLEQINDFKSAARVALQRVGMVYYKPQEVYRTMRNQTTGETYPESSREFMDNLVSLIFEYGDERTKARAMLYDIYHHTILDEYPATRDLLLTSNLEDEIQSMDLSSKILFHRAMAQLGLCAFRAGLVDEAYECLTELYQSGPVRENLAQCVSHSLYQEKTPEKEKAERRRQMPYHMHINVELLEATHLTCAFLAERPCLRLESKYKHLNPVLKTFRCLVEISERQAFEGPPENVRAHIMAVTRAVKSGACDSFEGVHVKFDFSGKYGIIDTLKESIKEEALRAYLLSYSSCYESIRWDQMAMMVDLDQDSVFSVLIRMRDDDELDFAWDDPTLSVVFRNVEQTRS